MKVGLFYKRKKSEKPRNRNSKILLTEHFGTLKKVRLYSLLISALGLPLLAILFTASGMVSVATFTLVLALIGSLISELTGRYLFYRTVVPLGLAGNFFAGNQRG